MTPRRMRGITKILSGRLLYLVLVGGLLGVAIGLAQENPGGTGLGGSTKSERLREGKVLVDLTGYFKMTGDRATFFTSDKKHRLGALENLNLQRVVENIADNRDQLQWVVSGTVSEYQGSNYILLDRVILKNRVNQKNN